MSTSVCVRCVCVGSQFPKDCIVRHRKPSASYNINSTITLTNTLVDHSDTILTPDAWLKLAVYEGLTVRYIAPVDLVDNRRS